MTFPRPALRRAVLSILPLLAALLAGGVPLSNTSPVMTSTSGASRAQASSSHARKAACS